MDDLTFLRERIESYADYTNDDARTLADEQIRAFVGVALSRTGERLQPADNAAQTLDRLLLRCQFADQLVIRALTSNDLEPAELAAIHRLDRELVTQADRADTITAEEVDSYFGQIVTALDARARIILNGAASSTAGPPRVS